MFCRQEKIITTLIRPRVGRPLANAKKNISRRNRFWNPPERPTGRIFNTRRKQMLGTISGRRLGESREELSSIRCTCTTHRPFSVTKTIRNYSNGVRKLLNYSRKHCNTLPLYIGWKSRYRKTGYKMNDCDTTGRRRTVLHYSYRLIGKKIYFKFLLSSFTSL